MPTSCQTSRSAVRSWWEQRRAGPVHLCFTAQDSGDANQKSFRVLVQGSGVDEASMPVQQTLYQLTTCKAPENDS